VKDPKWELMTPMSDKKIVDVKHLSKRYGKIQAVSDVSFSIPEQSVFGLLGPNGAGKTSIIEMIEGLRVPDSGTISVAGLNPVTQARQVKQIIGAQLQQTALHEKLRINEMFRLFGSFYKNPKSVDEVLQIISLADKKDRFVGTLSGGEKQRVALGLAVIGNPKVIFLDEPTAGLDVEIRCQLHDLILRLRKEGAAILLTTHYIEEAEKLCDLVGILKGGQLRAVAHPLDLIRGEAMEERVEVTFLAEVDPNVLGRLRGVAAVTGSGRYFTLSGAKASAIVGSIMAFSDAEQNGVEDLKIHQPRLEDAYLHLTHAEDTK